MDEKASSKEKEFLIRDEKGNIYNKVTRPAVVMDKQIGIYLKIGTYESMVKYYESMCASYISAGFKSMVANLVVMEIPHNQEEIDKIFQITGYIGKLFHMANKAN